MGKTNKIARLGLIRADKGEQVYTNLFLDSPNAHEITPYGLLGAVLVLVKGAVLVRASGI